MDKNISKFKNSKFIIIDFESFYIFNLDLENFIKFYMFDFLKIKDTEDIDKAYKQIIKSFTPRKLMMLIELLQKYNMYIIYNVPTHQNVYKFLKTKLDFFGTTKWNYLDKYNYLEETSEFLN